MKEEIAYWMALAHTEHIYTKRKNEIIVACYNKKVSIVDFFQANEEQWKNEYMVKEEEIEFLNEAKSKVANYSFTAEDLLEQGYKIIPITSEVYPAAVKKNLKYNSPVIFYTKGNTALLNQKSVAIVGSRNAKPISLTFTDNIAKSSAQREMTVVSGYAKGVDREALEASVAVGGTSIIVLPQGITTFGTGFKALHKYISTGKVVVVSAFAPTAPWSVGLAMARNPIIYAFADEIYVAESDNKGGTFAGVTDGLKKNRVIYVRLADNKEKCANQQLINMGAVAVDINGNIAEVNIPQEKTYKEMSIFGNE